MRTSVLLAVIIAAGLLALCGCEPTAPAGAPCIAEGGDADVTVFIPSEYESLVGGAEFEDHWMRISTPAISSGHDYEVDMMPVTQVGRRSLIIHTGLSPATTIAISGSKINIQVQGNALASGARFGVATNLGIIEAFASSGWIVLQFSETGYQGYADLITEDPRVPADLRHYQACFAGVLPQDAA